MNTHRARKRFGQNFLHDPAIIERIIRTINPTPEDSLIEIGPGLGAITVPLLRAAGALQVIELDRDLLAPLTNKCADIGTLTIHNADALTVNPCDLVEQGKVRIIGNLPYNISTPLLFHLGAHARCVTDMHFMLQKEVVDRMTAEPGSKAWGRLSIMLQYRFSASCLFSIGPGAFRPAPRVNSAFVRLVPHTAPPVMVNNEESFSRLVRQAFSQRRKTLRNSLSGLLDAGQISACDIDPGRRPEQLSLEEFARLANSLAI